MQVIGFNFTKISTEKSAEVIHPNITTNIEFTDVQKEKIDLLKDKEAAAISFKYSLNYENTKGEKPSEDKSGEKSGEVLFEGKIVLSIEAEESKNLQKAWKNKELPNSFKVPLFNLILKKCTPKAISLQDELGLPFHIPMPKLERKD